MPDMRRRCASGVSFVLILKAQLLMKDRPANLPASILARLRNIAEQADGQSAHPEAIRHQEAALSAEHLPHRDQFSLKGAMLFTAWLEDPFRPTQNLDLLGFVNPDVTAIRFRNDLPDRGRRRRTGVRCERPKRRGDP
ncbi:hypothetical protein MPLA_670066 [Mesorhizobium sp. ORS 3359]|nr:hypothetical protein MPLA_670066 [Mesorhizobium sp. ORS 3359]